MKLEDYYAMKGLPHINEDKESGLHVIGTCGHQKGCKHWERETEEGWGSCKSPQKDGQIGTVGYDFGCIHWEEKK